MMIRKIYLFSFLIILIAFLTRWHTCSNFKNEYHFSIYNLKLVSDNLIHNDINVPFLLIRLYHNKIILLFISLYTSYLLFWDIKFISNLFLFTGFIGIMSGFIYGYKIILQHLWLRILTLTMLVVPVIEYFANPAIIFPLKVTLYSVPFVLFSLFGNITLIERFKGYKIFVILTILLILSVWWNIYSPYNYKSFCQ